MKVNPVYILLVLFILGAARMLIELFFYYDDFGFVAVSATYSMLYYVFAIYSSIPYWAIRFVKLKSEVNESTERDIYLLSLPLWIVYPLVPVITILTSSSYSVEVPLFEWVPTFMTKRNFFPTGMIAVIPAIVLYFIFLFRKKLNAPLPYVFVAVVASCTLLYVLFYQWFLGLFYFLTKEFNYPLGFGVYHLIMAVYLQFVISRLLTLFPETERVFKGFNVLNSIIFAFVLLYGVFLLL